MYRPNKKASTIAPIASVNTDDQIPMNPHAAAVLAASAKSTRIAVTQEESKVSSTLSRTTNVAQSAKSKQNAMKRVQEIHASIRQTSTAPAAAGGTDPAYSNNNHNGNDSKPSYYSAPPIISGHTRKLVRVNESTFRNNMGTTSAEALSKKVNYPVNENGLSKRQSIPVPVDGMSRRLPGNGANANEGVSRRYVEYQSKRYVSHIQEEGGEDHNNNAAAAALARKQSVQEAKAAFVSRKMSASNPHMNINAASIRVPHVQR